MDDRKRREESIMNSMYSEACIKRPRLGQKKIGLNRGGL